MLKVALLVVSLGLLLIAAPAQAASLPVTAAGLVDNSSDVLVVRTISATPEWVSPGDVSEVVPGIASSAGLRGDPGAVRRTIVTRVELEVVAVLKGALRSNVTLRVPGGAIGPWQVIAFGAPSFRVGSRDVVFLDAAGRVVAGAAGRVAVVAGRLPGLGRDLRSFERLVSRRTGVPAAVLLPAEFERLRRSPVAGPKRRAPLGLTVITATLRPEITDITPGSASAGTGTRVTIRGRHFGARKGSHGRVRFTWLPGEWGRPIAAKVVSWSDRRIVCTVPVGVVAGYRATACSGPVTVQSSRGARSRGFPFRVTFSYLRARWSQKSCTYRVNPNTPDMTGERDLVDAAVRTWNGSGADFSMAPEGAGMCATTEPWLDGHNDVFWADLGYGLTGYMIAGVYNMPDSGVPYITEFDIVCNDSLPWSGFGVPNEFDVQTVVLHELGHVVGMRDLYGRGDSAKTMYGLGRPGKSDRTLASSDIAGARWVYGFAETPEALRGDWVGTWRLAAVTDGTGKHLLKPSREVALGLRLAARDPVGGGCGTLGQADGDVLSSAGISSVWLAGGRVRLTVRAPGDVVDRGVVEGVLSNGTITGIYRGAPSLTDMSRTYSGPVELRLQPTP